MKDYKKIIESIPNNWEELKFHQFKKLIHIPLKEDAEHDGIHNGMDNTLQALSILTCLSIEELESLPLSIVNKMAIRINFLTKEPNVKDFKTSIKWKELKEITYDNYVTFHALTKSNPFDNLRVLLSSFSYSKMTEEEIDNLSTANVLSGFFLLKRIVNRYLKSSIKRESFKLTKLMWKKAIQTLFRRRTKE